MQNISREILLNLVQVPILLFLLWAVYSKFASPKPLPRILVIPGQVLRIVLILVAFGLLAGCVNSDPIAVASGPLFPLNAGHWQPTPQQLAAPPVAVDR